MTWLAAYLFTIAFEIPVIAWGLRRAFPSSLVLIVLTFGASAITHPLLWHFVPAVETVDARLLIAELIVALVEASFFHLTWAWKGAGNAHFRHCLLVALIANGISFGLGRLLF